MCKIAWRHVRWYGMPRWIRRILESREPQLYLHESSADGEPYSDSFKLSDSCTNKPAYENAVGESNGISFKATFSEPVSEPVSEPNKAANKSSFNESDECSNELCSDTFADREPNGSSNQPSLQRRP